MSELTRPTRRFLGRPDGADPGYVPPSVTDRSTGLRPLVGEHARAGRLWMVQAASGALLIVFLGVHLVAQHLLVPGGLRDYDAVLAYLRQPIAVVAELGLLGSVIVHVVLGLRAGVVELVSNPVRLRWITIGLWAAGALIFGYAVSLTALLISAG
jgi:succinate dehydrogenase hydrophobic anchor subunit